ncbi:alpha-glucan family phosphorylase [Candidatus Saccharibacteria bacterium]|nr:alpha-glucan family phosphorylase [Candidatus Saccharibacteria bacterium]
MGDNTTYYDQINLEKEMFDIEDASEFYEVIDRKRLTHSLLPDHPYVYWTMEIYDQANGIKGGGGLGVLAADTRRVAQQLELPFVVVTPFYRTEYHQTMKNHQQVDYEEAVSPDDFGFTFIDNVDILTADGPVSQVAIFVKQLGSTKFVTVSEPNFGALYSGESNSDHRLYQEVALGFGGYMALKKIGLKPSVIQLNETATIFAAISRLDELCANGMNLHEAIVYVRKHTLYTNHTLLQAAEGEFSFDQFSKYVFPNIKSRALRHWIEEQFDLSGRLRNSALAIELTEAKNGVSRLHAKVTDFRDSSGERVKFHAVTNGIDMDNWVLPETMKTFRDRGIIDKFGMVTDVYRQQLYSVTANDIREHKKLGRSELNNTLAHRKDQYDQPVNLPENAVVYNFKRRFVSYKRPYMPFEHIPTLKRVLSNHDAHYILAGKVHQGDREMYTRMQELLEMVDEDPFLKERVHFIQDYDEELGRALAVGADVAINVPEVGLEACGTSWEKDIANLGILISTPDGGVADVTPLACLEVRGATYAEEVASLYVQMNHAGRVLADDDLLQKLIYRQLSAYLPVISGARMMKDYLRFLFDK